MRILLVHNRYQQRGGEDQVFETERAILEARGHQVQTLEFDNASIPAQHSPLVAARLAAGTVWSRSAAARVTEAVREHPAEVVHFHNTFPLVSPAAYYAARRAGAAVVQTLHNYRLLCPNALFYRDGAPCEDCLGRRISWPGILHACYRDSRTQTAAVAAMQAVHRAVGTWRGAVDAYIALTEFGRWKFIEGGLPPERIEVKPNFIHFEGSPLDQERRGYLYVGRLDETKGIATMLDAWRALPDLEALRIAGDGPLLGDVSKAASQLPNATALGRLSRSEVLMEMAVARALVFPSRWYEGFPVTIAEAFASGTPVIASRLGAMAELVEDRRTGLLFEPGNASDLATKVAWAAANPADMAAMGGAARAEYEAKYAPERNYDLLMEIYERATARRKKVG
jgi:glycosyltransferase involved in cell wall biosynthesis